MMLTLSKITSQKLTKIVNFNPKEEYQFKVFLNRKEYVKETDIQNMLNYSRKIQMSLIQDPKQIMNQIIQQGNLHSINKKKQKNKNIQTI